MNEEITIAMRAMADVVRSREASSGLATSDVLDRITKAMPQSITMPPNITVESPEIHNEVISPDVTVTVDMTPVADAIDRMAESINQLVAALANRPAIEVKPVVNVPAPVVNISPPKVHVAAPNVTVEVPERKKRQMTIQHDDGTKSVVKEE